MNQPQTATNGARRWLWVIVASLAVVLVLVVVAVLGGWIGSPSAGPSAGPLPSSSAPATMPSAELPTPTPGSTETRPALAPTEGPIDQPLVPASGVTVSVGSLEAVEGEPRGPGEIAGPALRVGIQILNTSGSSLDLNGAVVNVYYGADITPAASVNGPGGVPFPTSVASGESAVSLTIFTVPLAERADVRITLDLSAATPTTVFVGEAPQ